MVHALSHTGIQALDGYVGMSVGRGHETTSEEKKSRGREGSRTFMTEKEAARGRTAQRRLLGGGDQLKQIISCMEYKMDL